MRNELWKELYEMKFFRILVLFSSSVVIVMEVVAGTVV